MITNNNINKEAGKDFAKDKDGKSFPAKGPKRFVKKKVCAFCQNKVEHIDYIALCRDMDKSAGGFDKNGERRQRFVTEKGKIIPRRMSGVCLKHQRLLAQAVKRGRIMALLPFKAE